MENQQRAYLKIAASRLRDSRRFHFLMIECAAMKSPSPNPAGREGKPITLAPLTFDEAVRKMLATPPPKHEPKAKPQKKSAKRKR